MQGAFVVRLGGKTNPSIGHFEGSIEEVDSGKELKFQSSAELLQFLGERFQTAFEDRPEQDRLIAGEDKREASGRSEHSSDAAPRDRRR